MYNKTEICSCKVYDEEGRGYYYRYFLLQSNVKIETCITSINVPAYGIEVISEEISDGKIIHIDGDTLICVSPFKLKVMELIELLKNNSVSPVHLVDIVGAYADDWVEDFDKTARNLSDGHILA